MLLLEDVVDFVDLYGGEKKLGVILLFVVRDLGWVLGAFVFGGWVDKEDMKKIEKE